MAILRRLAATWWIRALVTVGLLAVVASRVDFGDASKRFSSGSWGWLAAAVVVLFASFLVAALRWHILLRAASIHATLEEAGRTYLIGAFSTNFLPSQVGGDATRAWMAGSTGNRIRAATTVVVDRTTGLGCLILMAWAFCVVRSGEIPRALVLALTAATVVAVVAGLVAGGVLRGNPRIGGWLPERAGAWAGEARLAVRSALQWPCSGGSLFWALPFRPSSCFPHGSSSMLWRSTFRFRFSLSRCRRCSSLPRRRSRSPDTEFGKEASSCSWRMRVSTRRMRRCCPS